MAGKAPVAPAAASRIPRLVAHKDERLREEQLDTHLKLLVRTSDLDVWHDRGIVPGEKWEGRINENLQRADIVLLLLSPDFIASDYCDKEMEVAMQREAAGQAQVVPIIALALRLAAFSGRPNRRFQGRSRSPTPAAIGPYRRGLDGGRGGHPARPAGPGSSPPRVGSRALSRRCFAATSRTSRQNRRRGFHAAVAASYETLPCRGSRSLTHLNVSSKSPAHGHSLALRVVASLSAERLRRKRLSETPMRHGRAHGPDHVIRQRQRSGGERLLIPRPVTCTRFLASRHRQALWGWHHA